eukprot:TRINITY_DN34018_c1_g1_i3.p1 TRINITY_DN34018_c1_g1~~TRINITY_DN34018_c1_g1_i3.p1  ORF type:complete len:184 (+),score=48.90 TRINITY_DN34018_c1_g1_i3:285-836(+)
MLLTVAMVVLTTLTLTPTSVTSATTTTTTTASPAETTTPVTNAAICSMTAEDGSVTLEQGETKSYLARQGVAFNSYTCVDADTNNMTMTTVECGDKECIDPVSSATVAGNYTCSSCEALYDSADPCVDDANSNEACQDTEACYNNPELMMDKCCLSCKDNTPAEDNPPTTQATTEQDNEDQQV